MTLWQNKIFRRLGFLGFGPRNAATSPGYTQYPRYIVPLTTLNIHRCHWWETNGLLATALPPSFCSCGPWSQEFIFFSFNGGRSDVQTLKIVNKLFKTRKKQLEKKGRQEFFVAPSLINHLWDKQEVVCQNRIAKVPSSPSSCVERLEHRRPDVWRPAVPFAGNREEHQNLSCTARVPENNLKKLFNKYQGWLCRTQPPLWLRLNGIKYRLV